MCRLVAAQSTIALNGGFSVRGIHRPDPFRIFVVAMVHRLLSDRSRWKCGKSRIWSVRYRSLVTDTYSHHTLLIVCRYKVIETAMLRRMKNQPQPSARSRFAHAMKQFRQERGLSQEKLAEMTGLHRTYIGSVERGERNISVDNMEAIARAMALDIGCFF